MQLFPRGLGGGGGEKTAPPPETQHIPPPPPKPAVPPKPQVRIQPLHLDIASSVTEPVSLNDCKGILYICVWV